MLYEFYFESSFVNLTHFGATDLLWKVVSHFFILNPSSPSPYTGIFQQVCAMLKFQFRHNKNINNILEGRRKRRLYEKVFSQPPTAICHRKIVAQNSEGGASPISHFPFYFLFFFNFLPLPIQQGVKADSKEQQHSSPFPPYLKRCLRPI